MVNDTAMRRVPRKILFLSEAFSAETVRRRGIPMANVAAWNRTATLVRLLEQRHFKVSVLSSGVTWRSRTGFAVHRGTTEAIESSTLLTTAAIGPRYVARALGVVLLIGSAFAHLWRERPTATIAYNYSFVYLLIGIWSLMLGIRFIVDIEDIMVPAPDRGPMSIENLKRRVLMRAMHWTLRTASAFIVPARSFARKLGLDRRFAVIEYSMAEPVDDSRFEDERVNVLFCGPYAQAHGFALLLDALKRLHERGTLRHFRFHLTGPAPDAETLAHALGTGHDDSVVRHGFLSAGDYLALLSTVDVGLSLQLRTGHLGETNVPSKSFEFLAAGVLLVCTEVGDQGAWTDRAVVLRSEDPASLVTVLESIAADRSGHERLRRTGVRAAARDWNAATKAEQLDHLITNA